MKYFCPIFFAFLFLSINILPQVNKSVHQRDLENYGTAAKQPGLYDLSGKDIIPLKKEKSAANCVFGYLPDWEYSSDRQYLKYNLLTHIAAFDFTVSSSGAITNPSYWPWTDVIDSAHNHGVKIILCAVCFDTAAIRSLLTNSTVKQTFFSNLKSKITQYQLDGVNIDFEGMKTALRGSLMNTFMQDLTTYMHTQIPGSEVSFAGPAVNWGGWDLPGLANACDYIFIMGYDFYGSWSTTTGPSAPLTGGSYNITNTVNVQYAGINPQKLILGCPYYGDKWMTRTNLPHASVTKFIGSTFAKSDFPNYNTYGKKWASDNQVPWYTWQNNDTSWYQVWFDNDSSLSLKYDLAKSKNFKGIGMWALGYDGSLTVLWELLRRSIFVPVELSSFSAECDGNNVNLNWSTATETNNYGFELFRTNIADNKKINLTFIKGAGSSSIAAGYSYTDVVPVQGRYLYTLVQMDYDGTANEIASKEIAVNTNMKYLLGQNYPNPFNPNTTISYRLAISGPVTIKVYDILGNEVKTLVNEYKLAGNYTANFDASKLSSGVYIYRITAGSFTASRKMTIIK
jgi:spore germination protein YaaH